MSLQSNITSKRFGRWTVVSFSYAKCSINHWLCRCDCGTNRVVSAPSLIKGKSKSCGCLRKEVSTKHGGSRSRSWYQWSAMIQRCHNPRHRGFHSYGGRGISVCEEWKNDFSKFISSMGQCPPDFTIERIDNDKGYSPDNCRWASRKEQMRNIRPNRWVELHGERMVLTDWASRYGISPSTIYARLRRGWPMESAITSPKRINQYDPATRVVE